MSAPTPSDRVDAQGPIPAEDVVAGWFHELSNWGRWGSDDELGTLNLITPAVRRAAAALVSEGESVSCAWDIDTSPRPDQVSGNPLRHMLSTGQGLNDPERPGAEHAPEPRTGSSSEWIGLAFHGYSVTHLDSLCHMFLDGRMYNDRPAAWVTAREGALANAVTAAGAGITTRGSMSPLTSLATTRARSSRAGVCSHTSSMLLHKRRVSRSGQATRFCCAPAMALASAAKDPTIWGLAGRAEQVGTRRVCHGYTNTMSR